MEGCGSGKGSCALGRLAEEVWCTTGCTSESISGGEQGSVVVLCPLNCFRAERSEERRVGMV